MILKTIILVSLTLLLSQTISGIIDAIKGKRFSINFFTKLGGMPSSHTATTSALTTAIFFMEGLSPLFLLSFLFTIIVMRDSYGIRYEVGEQAKLLNKKYKTTFLERVGHTKLEVLAGAAFGILVVCIGFMVF